MPLSPNQRGALFMMISQVAFTLSDTFVKIAAENAGVGQIIAVRGVMATTLVMLLARWLGHMRTVSIAAHPMVLVRVAGEAGATVFYLIALAHLPIANVSAVFQSLPLAVTMGAALFLGEKVGPRRWLAITAGLVGIMLIVRPGMDGFNTYSIYVLVCVVFCTIRDLATRLVPDHIPSMFISMLTSGAVTTCGVLIIPFTGGWQPVTPSLLALLATAAVMVLTGYQFIINSMRIGDISFVAPFRYSNLLWAIAIGILVFGEMPDWLTVLGSAIVVGSGLYSLYRERVTGRSRLIAESTGPNTAADGL